MRIGVIIPVHNRLDETQACLQSFMRTTPGLDLLVTVVDNGSDAETATWLRAFAVAHRRVRVLQQANNLGWVHGVNAGWKWLQVQGRFDAVLLLNNDVLFEQPDWLSKLSAALEPADAGAVGPVSNGVPGVQNVAANLPWLSAEPAPWLSGFCVLVKGAVFAQLQGLDPQFGRGETGLDLGCDDWDLGLRISQAGYKNLIVRDVFVYHVMSATIRPALAKLGVAYDTFWERGRQLLKAKWGAAEIDAHLAPKERFYLALCVPYRNGWTSAKFASTLRTLAIPGKWALIDIDRFMIAEARNLMVQRALDLGCTHVLFVDDDMILPRDALVRLLHHNMDIVSALAFQRRGEHLPCVFRLNADHTQLYPIECIRQGLQPFDAVGSAFTLIRTEVFRTLKAPWYVYADKSLDIYEEVGGVGEDLSFCLKAKRAGFSVWADTDLIIKHLGDPPEVDETQYLDKKAARERAEASVA